MNNHIYAVPNALQMKFQQKLTVLGDAFNVQKGLAMPKKKFTFGNRAKNVKKKEKPAEEGGATGQPKVEEKKEEEVAQGNHLYFKDLKNGNICVKKEEYEGKENVDIQNIEDTTIDVPFPVKVVFMKNVKNCTLNFAAITASAHINNVEGSTLQMASHQIRIHHTTDTKFYLLARSNPIIEHSKGLGFGDLTK